MHERLKRPGAPSEPSAADGLDLQPHQRMHRERVELRRAERDDPGHELRAARGEHVGERAAAALADDRGRLPARATSFSRRCSSRSHRGPEQSTLARMPALRGR